MVLANITDVGLRAALSEQGTSAQPINVLVKMQPPRASSDAAEAASEVIRRVADKLHVMPQYRYRKLDDTVHIFAPKKFVRELVEQPEVLTAYSAAMHDSALIPPVQQHPVSIEAVDRRMKTPRKVIARASRTRKTHR